jgi:hypothetical protein
MDGAAHNVPDAPKVWHVWENKASGKKAFDGLTRLGAQVAKPKHWAQLQWYMHLSWLMQPLYKAVCKDNDELYVERVDYDAQAAAAFVAKAKSVIAPLPQSELATPTGTSANGASTLRFAMPRQHQRSIAAPAPPACPIA